MSFTLCQPLQMIAERRDRTACLLIAPSSSREAVEAWTAARPHRRFAVVWPSTWPKPPPFEPPPHANWVSMSYGGVGELANHLRVGSVAWFSGLAHEATSMTSEWMNQAAEVVEAQDAGLPVTCLGPSGEPVPSPIAGAVQAAARWAVDGWTARRRAFTARFAYADLTISPDVCEPIFWTEHKAIFLEDLALPFDLSRRLSLIEQWYDDQEPAYPFCDVELAAVNADLDAMMPEVQAALGRDKPIPWREPPGSL